MPAIPSTEEIKSCALCGGEFACNARGPGCWCEAVEVPRERLLPVREVTHDCLCPRCLRQVAAAGE
jgi:hypothetical protein